MASDYELARNLADMSRRLVALERAPRLRNSSIDGSALPVYDADGTLRQVIGQQPDGTYTITDVNGPKPPTPTAATLVPQPEALVVTWDGGFVDGGSAPADFAHVEVHLSAVSGYTPTSETQVSTFATRKGGSVTLGGLHPVPYYVVLVAVSTSAVESDPSPVAVESALDPARAPVVVPPAVSPELTVYPTPRGLIVQAATIPTGTQVQYHISLTDGFTPTDATLWGTAGMLVNIENLPNGTLLAADTTYYLRAVATNDAGTAPRSSTQVTGQLRLADSSTIATLTTDKLVAGDLIGVFALLGSLQVGNITITPTDGISIPQPDGTTIQFPADGSPAQIPADLIAYSLTVLNNLTVRGVRNEVSNGAKIYLAASIGDPQMPPNVVSTWDFHTGFAEPGTVTKGSENQYALSSVVTSARRGLHRAGNVFATAWATGTATGGHIELYDISTNTQLPDVKMPAGFDPVGGVTKIGSNWYVFGKDYNRAAEWYVYQFNGAWGKTKDWWWGVATRAWNAVIGNDGTNIVVASVLDNGSLVIRGYTPASPGTKLDIAAPYPITTNAVPTQHATGLYVGNADFGALRYVVTTKNTLNVIDANGVTVASQAWPSANSTTWRGIVWDGTRFYSMDAAGQIWGYSRNLKTTQDIAFSWYDNDPLGSGQHETKVSPVRRYTAPARSWLNVTTPVPSDTGESDAPNAVRIYVAPSARGGLVRQPDLATGVVSAVYDVPITAGFSAPVANTFSTATLPSGSLTSAGLDGAGALIELRGNGSGRVGPMVWGTDAKLTKPLEQVWTVASTADVSLTAEGLVLALTIPAAPAGAVYQVTAQGDAMSNVAGSVTTMRLRYGGTAGGVDGTIAKAYTVEQTKATTRHGYHLLGKVTAPTTSDLYLKLTALPGSGATATLVGVSTPTDLFVRRIA